MLHTKKNRVLLGIVVSIIIIVLSSFQHEPLNIFNYDCELFRENFIEPDISFSLSLNMQNKNKSKIEFGFATNGNHFSYIESNYNSYFIYNGLKFNLAKIHNNNMKKIYLEEIKIQFNYLDIYLKLNNKDYYVFTGVQDSFSLTFPGGEMLILCFDKYNNTSNYSFSNGLFGDCRKAFQYSSSDKCPIVNNYVRHSYKDDEDEKDIFDTLKQFKITPKSKIIYTQRYMLMRPLAPGTSTVVDTSHWTKH